ncbi:MAG: PAS domain-containing sensor histidine kinase [Sphingobacteriaceae bacterium]|nr:MAG: PAS domain-containing sensor histidine kinase [Sphingobacteriaceae bacterium]
MANTYRFAFLIQYRYSFYIYLLLLALVLTAIMIVLAIKHYKQLKKATGNHYKAFPESHLELNALLNSLNDIIFECNEDKVCLNAWFNKSNSYVVDIKTFIGKTPTDVLGGKRAAKFNHALDYVIKHRKPTSIEFASVFGTDRFFLAKLAPVFDSEGNYLSRISASVSDISEQKKYADALKQNELLLLEAQHISRIGNWWYDFKSNDSYWSASLFSILGTTTLPNGINKYNYYISLVHPDDVESYTQYLANITTSPVKQHEHRLITPNGDLKYIKVVTGDLLLDSDGNIVRVHGIIQDVTEARLAEKAVKIGRTELVEAQTIAKIGNWNWDTSLKIIKWSDEIANTAELSQQFAGQYSIIKLLLKHTHQHDRFILQHFLKSVSTINNYTCVFRIVTSSGKIKYVSIIVGKLITREDGSIKKIVGTLQDITDRKQAEIDFKLSESKYKLVLETIKLAALSVDKNGTITFCNHHLANLLGYDQDQIIGKNWTDFIPSSQKEVIAGWLTDNAVKPQYINPVICRSGEQRIISWQNTVVHDEYGQIKETTSIGEDITDQQKATEALIYAKELAEKASEFKSEFLSIMSHEIRTPMNAVIGTTNLLLSEDPKPEQLEYLNILKFSGENLLAIINDILDYNKIEAGKLELNDVLFDIHSLAQKIRKSFSPKALEKQLEIELIIDKAIPQFVLGDQMRLSQILNNLIGNAVKFTHKGKIAFSMDKESVDETQVTIKFTIADTGIGIAEKNLKMIFDPFMQESQFINSHTGGTGLGLAITKRLIELHKSNIYVISELDKGTQFTFSLSYMLPEKKDIEPAKDDSTTLNLYGMNILIVDDNKMNLFIASKFLKKWQANVDEALDGSIAVNMVNNKIYDVIIMDLQMPVMDGFEASRIIKALYPDLPIIALTADAMPETYNKALEAGMSDYLTKPFIPGMFFEKISKYYKPRV